MKIVEIMPVMEVCGVTRFVVDLCNRLAQEHEVVLVVLYQAHNVQNYGISPKVRLVEMHKRRGFDWTLCHRLRNRLREEKADVVHIHSASALNYTSAAVLTLRQSRYFYTLHSEAAFENPSPLSRLLTERFIFRPGLCRTIANSRFTAQTLSYSSSVIDLGRELRECQLEDKRAEETITHIRQRHKGTILLSVANLTPVKNQMMLCRAVRNLARRGYNIELVLIGKAPDDAYFQRVRPLLHHPRIHYIGPRNKAAAYMAHADFFCLSSETESGPLVLIEAFFAGLIPICTPCGDVPNKIHHGENGFISADMTEKAYTQVLETALRLPKEKRINLQSKVRESYKKYTMENCTAKHLHLFNSK